MKANKIQNYLCDIILSQQSFWRNSNDITSPTHLNDIEEECYSQLDNLISDEDREEFEEKLKDLYWFIRKFDLAMKANEAPEKLYISNYDSEVRYNWHRERLAEKDIEYVRKDAFIEEACKWLEDNAIEYWGTEAVDNGMMIVEFKKAMRL